ncbi:MAG: hypothetical protein EOO38_07850, partial [Cytophagaceae bacterium]
MKITRLSPDPRMTVSKILTVAVAGLAMSTTAMAVNLVAPTQVIARVGGSCSTAVADALDFGTLTASAVSGVSQTDATGTVSITCTNAISFSVVVSEGMYSPGISQRRMQAASRSTFESHGKVATIAPDHIPEGKPTACRATP